LREELMTGNDDVIGRLRGDSEGGYPFEASILSGTGICCNEAIGVSNTGVESCIHDDVDEEDLG
jgi:hypothetical protein